MHPYLCYCLKSVNPKHRNRTYCGITNHFKRRLRQHNGDLKSNSARYTKMFRPWKPFLQVRNFPNKRTVLQFEAAMKRRAKGSGIAGRCKTLLYLLSLDRVSKAATPMREMQLHVRCSLTEATFRRLANCPSWWLPPLHVNFEFNATIL